MTHQERRAIDTNLEQLVEGAVQRAFENMFEMFGTDVSTLKGRSELRDDFNFVRDARKGVASVRKTSMVAVIGTFVTGAAFGLWTMITWIASHTK